jgi:DNA-binding response OmpR family regulator
MNPPPMVLAMSGDGSTDPKLFLKTARQLGAREVLIKPFPLAELLGHLHGLIGTR